MFYVQKICGHKSKIKLGDNELNSTGPSVFVRYIYDIVNNQENLRSMLDGTKNVNKFCL